jgi:putative SOS response-associated peptidase YedK
VCGRFTLRAPPQEIQRVFGLDAAPRLEPRFNVAPGQDIATVHAERDGRRVMGLRRWGLVPHWAHDPRVGARLVNARAETAASRPAFRDAMRLHRCLVPADGFYEWSGAAGPGRQPHLVERADAGLFAIAGLYEHWRSASGEWLHTCTLLTVPANALLRAIHDRMPAILSPEHWDAWLDPTAKDAARAAAWLAPSPPDELRAVAVSRRVNRTEFDDPACIEPAEPGAGPGLYGSR